MGTSLEILVLVTETRQVLPCLTVVQVTDTLGSDAPIQTLVLLPTGQPM